MPSALCPHCNEPAFSSADFKRPWTCPSCGKVVVPPASDYPKKAFDPRRESVVDYYSRYWTVD